MNRSTPRRQTACAAGVYFAIALAWTWPLAAHLATEAPGDAGDPLFLSWTIAWSATHLFSRGWWSANIFYPHALTLAYSDHLAAQALQAMPMYAATRNPILCYNLLFLSTFVVSGVGMFLLVRELTGDAWAAFAGGIAFAFAPYRVASVPHLQVLSSGWMPFVFYALRRWFDGRRPIALAGAAAAWTLQNLSNGYYLLYFSPVVLAYIVWEVTVRRLWTDRRALVAMFAVVTVVVALTIPTLLPYLAVRSLGVMPRSIAETQRFSADVLAYATADPKLWLWGRIVRAWPRAEGSLFPGFVVCALAIAGAFGVRRSDAVASYGRRAAGVLVVVTLVVLLVLLIGGSIRLPFLKIASLPRAVAFAGAIGVAALVWSAQARQRALDWLRSPRGIFTLIALFAAVMSFGPAIYSGGRLVSSVGPYLLFYRYVPGFDGLRVPARFAMIGAFAIAALASFALASVPVRARRAAALGAAALILAESIALPLPLNEHSTQYSQSHLAPLPPFDRTPPPIYGDVAALPASVAIVELPLGEPAFDIRYVYYSTSHWRNLVNGYSGTRPADYEQLDQSLQDVLTRPERAWSALTATGATHALVHEAFYDAPRGPAVTAWLRRHGAVEVSSAGTDRLLRLPPRR